MTIEKLISKKFIQSINKLSFHEGATIQRHSGVARKSSTSKITVTDAGSASSDEGLNTNIIVHGKNNNTNNDDLL